MADASGRLSPAEGGAPPCAAQLLAAAPTPLFAIDAQGGVAHANAAAETLVNLSRAAMLGRGVEGLLGLALPEPAPVAAYDQALRLPGGRRQLADVQVAPWPERSGWRIVTLHLQSTVFPAARRGGREGGARAAAGAAAMLAHEIKNPLAGIRGAAQLLETEVAAEARSLARLIRDEVDRVAALIDRMEHFTDTRPLALSGQNIHAILTHVRALAEPGFARGIIVREHYDPSLPEVLGHRDALIQVLLNLLKNAGEALGGQGGTVFVTTAYRHGMHRRDICGGHRRPLPIEVCIIDDGPGAPGEIADQLFEAFVTSKPSGRGLGLALVHKLITDMGGLVEYAREGRPPRTVFRLLLPRAEEAA